MSTHTNEEGRAQELLLASELDLPGLVATTLEEAPDMGWLGPVLDADPARARLALAIAPDAAERGLAADTADENAAARLAAVAMLLASSVPAGGGRAAVPTELSAVVVPIAGQLFEIVLLPRGQARLVRVELVEITAHGGLQLRARVANPTAYVLLGYLHAGEVRNAKLMAESSELAAERLLNSKKEDPGSTTRPSGTLGVRVRRGGGNRLRGGRLVVRQRGEPPARRERRREGQGGEFESRKPKQPKARSWPVSCSVPRAALRFKE